MNLIQLRFPSYRRAAEPFDSPVIAQAQIHQIDAAAEIGILVRIGPVHK